MKNAMMGTYARGEENFNFDFYTELSTVEKLKFVNTVVNLIVDENYNSIIRDLVTDFCVIDIFTNVDVSELWNSSFFIKDVEQFLDETNIVDIVKANMADGLLEELNKAIDLDIQYKTGIHPNPLNEALASLVNTLEKKVNDYDMGSMMAMAQKFAGMTGEITIDNVVNAYMNSDVHKKNLEEIAESEANKVE